MIDRFLFFILVLLSISLNAQKIADYKSLEGSIFGKKVDIYITKSRDTLKIGDTLIIGKMSAENHFRFINQANQFGGSQLTGHKITIKKMLVDKRGKQGDPTLWVDFRGWGLYPVYISYEQAIESGEVINPNGKLTREQAINKLREAKELLELEVITQDEYDKLKDELTPIIVN